MITRLAGRLTFRDETRVVLDVNGIGYEVLLPRAVSKMLGLINIGDPVELVTLHYLQIDSSKATPVLIGFVNEYQKEFFERLLTVPKMGPKVAMSAFSEPVSHVAHAIERNDLPYLKSLPGIGLQKAKDMVATLQGKVTMYAMMRDEVEELPSEAGDVAEDALQVLQALGHRRAEAERMIQEALKLEPNPPDSETLLRIVYRREQESGGVG